MLLKLYIIGLFIRFSSVKTGDPLIKERVETANELRRYITLQGMERENRKKLSVELSELPARIKNAEEAVEKFAADREYLLSQTAEYTTQERHETGSLLVEAGMNSLGAEREMYVTQYRGFDLVMPINYSMETLRVNVRHEGSYSVVIGTSVIGSVVRLDNFFKNFDEIGKKMYESRDELKKRRKFIKAELSKNIDHSAKITEMELKLKEIDDRLGVG